MADETPVTAAPVTVAETPAASAPGGTDRDDALAAWTAVLDALEAELETVAGGTAVDAATEAATDGAANEYPEGTRAVVANWTPPHLDTPIPEVLTQRARRLNERQHAVLARLTADADTLRRHRTALGSVRAATAPRQSAVYLDVTG